MAKRRRTVYTSTGKAIRTFRKRLKLTLRGLSDRSGVSFTFLSQIENAERSASPDTLDAILKALELPPEHRDRIIRIAMTEKTEEFRSLLGKAS